MSKRFKRGKYVIVGAIFAVGFFSVPFIVTAQATTTIYFDLEKPTIYEGDTFLVNVRIDTPDTSINVVGGTILYDNSKLDIQEVSTGNSLFAFWPEPPSIANDKGELSFVGGVSSGFQGNGGNILRIVFLAKNEGVSAVDFLDGSSVFLNDGQGTKITPQLEPLFVGISERPPEVPVRNEWQVVLEKDTTPPDFVEVIISQNQYIFDNQYFVSFFAVDDGSGVAYYEIKEGSGDFIRTKSPYLLQDQSLESDIKIKAFDNAGNESITTPTLAPTSTPETPYRTYLIWIFVTLIIIAFIFWLWRLWVAKLRKNIQK